MWDWVLKLCHEVIERMRSPSSRFEGPQGLGVEVPMEGLE